METCYTYTEDGKCWFSSDERKTITRIRKLKEAHPDDVTILKQPEENDGCIYGWCPKDWVLLRFPKKMGFSDEEKAKRAERLPKRHQTWQTDASKKQEGT